MSTAPRRRWPAPAVLGAATLALVLAGQVLLGAVWWVANITAVPEYGDTPEYLGLSDTLHVDSFRTLLYPLLLRAAREVGSAVGVPWVALLYVGQLAVAVATTAFFVRALVPRISPVALLAVTGVLVTTLLPLHYTATVLTDSLATSFLLVLVAGLVRWAAHDDLGAGTVAALVGGTALSVLLRPDRLYISVAAGAVAWLVVAVRRTRSPGRRRVRSTAAAAAVLVLAVVVPAVAATAANRATQTAPSVRPPVTRVGTLYDRIAYPYLDRVRDRLPAELAAAVPPPPPEVTSPVAWRVETLARLRAVGGDDAVMTVVDETLACCAADVTRDVARDVLYGAGGPYTVARDAVAGTSLTPWNISRMSAHRPTLSRVVVVWSVVSTVCLGLLTVGLVTAAARRRVPVPPGLVPACFVLGGTVLAVAGAFGVVSSVPVNSRYTLACQIALAAVPLVWLTWTTPRGTRAAAGDDAVGPTALAEPDTTVRSTVPDART